jgi:hypothetical protein
LEAGEVVRFLQMFLSVSKGKEDIESAASSLFGLFCGTNSLCSLGSSIDSYLGKDDVFDIVLNMISIFTDSRNKKCLARLVLANLAFLVKVSSVAFTFFDKKLTKGTAMERYPVWHGKEGIKWEEFYFYSFDDCPCLKQFYLKVFEPEFINLGLSLIRVLMDKIKVSANTFNNSENFYDDVIHVTKYELIERLRVKLGEKVYDIKCNEYISSWCHDWRRDDEKFNELKLIDMTNVSSEEDDTMSHIISTVRHNCHSVS